MEREERVGVQASFGLALIAPGLWCEEVSDARREDRYLGHALPSPQSRLGLLLTRLDHRRWWLLHRDAVLRETRLAFRAKLVGGSLTGLVPRVVLCAVRLLRRAAELLCSRLGFGEPQRRHRAAEEVLVQAELETQWLEEVAPLSTVHDGVDGARGESAGELRKNLSVVEPGSLPVDLALEDGSGSACGRN